LKHLKKYNNLQLFSFSFLLIAFQICFSQSPQIEWQKAIGGNIHSVQQTTDGGYIFGGSSGDDYFILKLDNTGQNIEWQRTIGGDDQDICYSIQQTSDGGYILGGRSDSGISGDKTEANRGIYGDYWIVKLNPTGQTIEWQKTIGGYYHEYLFSIQQTSDGGYILGGRSDSDISGDKTEDSKGSYDCWVVKLNSTGQTIEWQRTIGGKFWDDINSIQQTSDGGYIFGGRSDSDISGDKTEDSKGSYDYWVVKLNSTGQTIEWQKTIGGSGEDELYSIRQTSDGGYILGGWSGSNISGDKTENNKGSVDYWIVKLNSTGQTIEWQKTIGGDDHDYLKSVQQTLDGGFICGGESWSRKSGDKTEEKIGGYDFWIVKLESDGKTLKWDKTIGTSNYDFLGEAQQTIDGGYIISGSSGWAYKLHSDPCINGSIIYNLETNKFNFCEDGVWIEK